MKNTLIIILIGTVSIVSGVWIGKNLESYFFIEEFYNVQNLDPNNEKDADRVRQQIQKLMWTTVPKNYQPDPERFQCFKIISENIFFCSMDTYRKHVAQNVKKLLQETVPMEIGWIPLDEATEKYQMLKEESESDQLLLSDLKKQFDKLKKQNSKQQSDEKRFIQTNNLYKKNEQLLEKKIEVLQQLINQSSSDMRSQYNIDLEQTDIDLNNLKAEISQFHNTHKDLAQTVEQKEILETQIQDMNAKIEKDQSDIASLTVALDQPNQAGKIADLSGMQLFPDLSKRKYDVRSKPTNGIWHSIFIFFILTNFVLRIRPQRLKSFLDDGTMTEARIS